VETWEGLEGEWLLWYYMGVGHILGGAVFLMLVTALSLPPQDAFRREQAQEEIKRVCE